MAVETSGDDLACSLARVASDPAQVASLHELLRGFCHQCRNTLNSLKLSFYLARRDATPSTSDALLELEPRYIMVERLLDRLQTICRPMALTTINAPLELLIEDRRGAWIETMAAHGRALELRTPDCPAVGEFDPVRLAEGLDALVAWRAEAGETGQPARLTWRTDDSQFWIEWDESGAWNALDADPTAEGSGTLALPFLARIISIHGGTLSIDARDGAHLRIQWPLRTR